MITRAAVRRLLILEVLAIERVLTYNDLSDFSDELQNEVKRILEMSR